MVAISSPPPLSGNQLQAYHTTDPALSNAPFVVLYGQATTSNASSANSARVQVHIFSPAGFQSYPRLVISPATPLYAAVSCLPQEEQGDEVLRALAFGIYKYFGDLPEIAKDEWIHLARTATTEESSRRLYTAAHAADLASRMLPTDNTAEVMRDLEYAYTTQTVSCIDLDLVLPPGSIREVSNEDDYTTGEDFEQAYLKARYGSYAPLVSLFGESSFLPTSKLQRAPSRPTALNRSLTFAKRQKETLRREMCELVNTEEGYVSRLHELVHEVVADFRMQARNRGPASLSPDERALEGLFPPSVRSILEINQGFFEAIRQVLDESEEAAIRDIDSTPDSSSSIHQPMSDEVDATGTIAFANTLLKWYPQFSDCYTDYIKSQPNFGRLMKSFTTNTTSTFSRRVQETGEQQLMSLLIEPVQRLPRYNLYIENIVKQLPVRHPALKLFLKAKDVISSICNMDDVESGMSKLARIQSIIPSWPTSFQPQGRFINAVDVVEMVACNDLGQQTEPCGMLLLLFAGQLVLLRKASSNAMSARTFMTEVDKGGAHCARPGLVDPGLQFLGSKPLSDINFSEFRESNAIRLIPSRPPLPRTIVSPNDDRLQSFFLTGSGEGRASRWLLEVMRARVEGRVPESERGGPKWEARLMESARHDLALFSAVFEEGNADVNYGRGRPGSVRVVVDPEKGSKKLVPGEAGVEIVVSVSVQDQDFYRIDIEALNARHTRDLVTETEFLPILIKRLGNLFQMRSQIRNPIATVYLLQHHSDILKSLSLWPAKPERVISKSRPKRSASPVKLLTNLFGNTSLKDILVEKPLQQPAPLLSNVPQLPRPQHTRSMSEDPTRTKENFSPSKAVATINRSTAESISSFELLEKALSCYLLALQARKGNVVGSIVSRRMFADRAVVNQLYNALLENPDDHERAAQAPIDVLFAAFEQFLNTVWKERLGPVIKNETMVDLQVRMGELNAFDYDEYEERILGELAPQNRRGLSAIIVTLADLLHGTRNDGDRGALTAAFAEIVVSEANPHDFIPLFDHFVENEAALSFQDSTSIGMGMLPNAGSVHSTLTTKSGSVNSKASSFSKRLGFGSLRRENSKIDQAKAVGSLMRMGSKRGLPSGGPVEKPLLGHTQFQGVEGQLTTLRRPGSQDRPSTSESFDGSRPATARSDQAIPNPPSAEISPARQMSRARAERRSSLSDIISLQGPGASPFWTNSASKRVDGLFELPSVSSSSLRKELPATPSKSASVRYGSPTKENAMPIERSQTVKETSPSRHDFGRPPPFAQAFAPLRAAPSGTIISKGPLSERMASGNTPPPPLHPASSKEGEAGSPRKLRVQNSAKIRERLQGNQSAIAGARSTLQTEIDKIGIELAELNSKSASPQKQDDATITNLTTRLKALESKLSHLSKNLTEHATTLEKDLNTSLQVAHKKTKALDAELQQANAENDVLYSRMNDELMKIFNQVQGGEALEEMKRLLQESQEEGAKWKKEAVRLKRENLELRTLLG